MSQRPWNEVERRWRRVRIVLGTDGLLGLVRLAERAACRRVRHARSVIGSARVVSTSPSTFRAETSPRLTVIVTTHNRSELLPIALRSIQLQDGDRWECIVVDDASTDDSISTAQQFVDADSRFRILVHDRNRGLAAARNTGIAAARGEFVCFLDDDDFLLEGSLRERLKVVAQAASGTAGSYCDWVNTDPLVGLERFRSYSTPRSLQRVSFVSLRHGTPFISSSPLVRRDVLEYVGGFDEQFERAEDAELWFRICRLGFVFEAVDHVGIAYRRSPGSMVTGAPGRQFDALLEVMRRADQRAPHLEGVGPAGVVEGLGELAASADRAAQLLPYLAMIALDDLDAAIRIGSEIFPDPVRRDFSPHDLQRRLTNYVDGRLALRDGDDWRSAAASVSNLVAALTNLPVKLWTPANDQPWVFDRIMRSAEVGPTPTIAADAALVDGAIVLIAESAYHVDELGPLGEELERRGHAVRFMLSPKTVPSARSAIARYSSEVLDFDLASAGRAAAFVVLNDWGPVRELLRAANDSGVPTFAKVEGVQDFDDVDTGRVRQAYRTSAFILGQGENDLRGLPGCTVEIVGSSRLERIWLGPVASLGTSVLVNLNFTFNVLTEQRANWIRSVCLGIEAAGMQGLMSTHPAERSRDVGIPIASKPFRHEITKCGILVSRFSTVPFEAMARGVPFVYHNPHGERVPAFQCPEGAFEVSRSTDELSSALVRIQDSSGMWTRDRWAGFFQRQIDVDPDLPSEVRGANAIESKL